MDRWSLPGPNRFLDEVIEGLRQGQNLVLGTPRYGPQDVAHALRDRLLADGWRVMGPLNPGPSDPIDALFEGLDLDDGGALRRTTTLLSQRMPAGQVVVVHGISRDTWPSWRKVLTEFEASSRSVSAFDRSLLIAVTEGVALAELQIRAAALKVLLWQGVVGELDMLLYASTRLFDRVSADFSSRLVAKIIAKLALWDFAVADELIEKPRTELFRPMELIAQIAAASEYGRTLGTTWEGGGLQRFDGVDLLHPFVHAANGDPKAELAMRVWAAQASEIFPALELRRRDLAMRMRAMVRLPIRVGDELVADLNDLEIGQLAHLASQHHLASTIRKSTDKWRRLRNKLAHLEVLEAHEALDPGLHREA